MSMRILSIDVGFGTTDILVWDEALAGENQVHLVVPSATQVVAREIEEATRRGLPVFFRGPLMGGGASTAAMKRHIDRGLSFFAEPSAARTFNDDLDRVAAMGVMLTDIGEAAGSLLSEAMTVVSGDVRFHGLLSALRSLGVPDEVDGCVIAVQDHGQAPPGVSDREFRFQNLAEIVARSPRLGGFFYRRGEIPVHATRMAAAASCVDADLSLVIGDTGPAAVWGASLAARTQPCLAVNYGNSHTLAARVHGDRLDGLFEHHTGLLDAGRMLSYLRRFAAGTLAREDVFGDGGHGALPVSAPFALEQTEILATGPRRASFMSMGIEQVEASLHGDMMITGCYGALQGYLAVMGEETR